MLLQVKPTFQDKLPAKWQDPKSWPGEGVYFIDTGAERNNLFVVKKNHVECLYDICHIFTFIDEEFLDDGEVLTESSADLAHMVIAGAKFNPKGE
jgi:hypothetical protein